MSLWILCPDPSKTCCGCAGRNGPCDSCGGCKPLILYADSLYSPYPIDNDSQIIQGYNNLGTLISSVPTGIIYKDNGFSTQISFTNSNSKLQAVSSTTDYNVNSSSIFNSSNFNFVYQLNINVGEKITLYTETVGDITQLIDGQSIGPFQVGNCSPYVLNIPTATSNNLFTQGNNTLNVMNNFTNIYSSIQATFNPISYDPIINNSVQDDGSEVFPEIDFNCIQAPNPFSGSFGQSNFIIIPDCNSISNSFHTKQNTNISYNGGCCPIPPCQYPTWQPGQQYIATPRTANGCSNIYYAETLDVLGGNNIPMPSINEIGVAAQSNFSDGEGIPNSSDASCGSAATFLSYKATWQLQSANLIRTSDGAQIPTTSICCAIQCNNNGYIQLMDSKGNPIDLTTRITLFNAVSSLMP